MKIDRIAWIWVLATFAIVGLFAAREALHLSDALSHASEFVQKPGWDLRPVCASFAALSEGKDPYFLKNIGGEYPLPYAIIAAYPAKFLCPILSAWPNAYIIIYLLLFVCSCAALAYLLLDNVVETALVAIVSISAFGALIWLALSGNIVIFEVPFAVLTILAVHQRRLLVGGVALGLMSSLKILPLVGVLAFLILPIGRAQKARAVAASLLTFSAIELVNFMVSAPYGPSYLKQLIGGIPDQVSPYFEGGDINNPDFIDLVFRFFGALGIEKTTLIASAIGLCGLAVGGWGTMLAQRSDETDKLATVRLFGLAYLVCMLFLFRLKPYAFATLIPFAIAAVMFPERPLRYIGYLVLVSMPWLWSKTVRINMAHEFYQTISLVIFLMVAFGLHTFRGKPVLRNDMPSGRDSSIDQIRKPMRRGKF